MDWKPWARYTHLKLWTVGAVELWGIPAQPRNVSPVREALGTLPYKWQAGEQEREWGKRGGGRAQGAPAGKLGSRETPRAEEAELHAIERVL